MVTSITSLMAILVATASLVSARYTGAAVPRSSQSLPWQISSPVIKKPVQPLYTNIDIDQIGEDPRAYILQPQRRVFFDRISVAPDNQVPVDGQRTRIPPGFPYCSAQIISDYVVKDILPKLSFEVPTPADRSLTTILFVWDTIALEVLRGVNYSEAYDTETILAVVAQLLVDEARDSVYKFVYDMYEQITPIRQQVFEVLRSKGLRGNSKNNLDACNREVDAIVRNNPQLHKAAALLVAHARLSEVFLEQEDQLQAVVASQTEKEFLANGKLPFKPVILHVAACYQALGNILPEYLVTCRPEDVVYGVGGPRVIDLAEQFY